MQQERQLTSYTNQMLVRFCNSSLQKGCRKKAAYYDVTETQDLSLPDCCRTAAGLLRGYLYYINPQNLSGSMELWFVLPSLRTNTPCSATGHACTTGDER